MGRGGDNMAVPGGAVPHLGEALYAPFLDESFDTTAFASAAVLDGVSSVPSRLHELQQGVDRLEVVIRDHLRTHQDALLASARGLGAVEADLDRTSLSVASLRSMASRVRADVAGPAGRVRVLTTQARNLQAAGALLQHVTHRLKLVAQLRSCVEGGKGLLEAASAARILSHIQALDESSDLDCSAVHAVASSTAFLLHTREAIKQQAESALTEALAGMRHADAGSALQVHFNLGDLPAAVQAHVDAAVARVDAAAAGVLDARRARSGGGALAAAASPDAVLAGVASVLQVLQAEAGRVWHLERVLARKHDAASGVRLLDVVLAGQKGIDAREGSGFGGPTPMNKATSKQSASKPGTSAAHLEPLGAFWHGLLPPLAARFEAACSAAAPPGSAQALIRDALMGEYPRLAGLLEDCCTALAREVCRSVQPAEGTANRHGLLNADGGFDPLAMLRSVAPRARAAYVAGVAARLQETVAGMLPPGMGRTAAPPRPADMQRLVARLHEELRRAAAGGADTAEAAAVVATAALDDLAASVRAAAAVGPDLRVVTGRCTPGVARNTALAAALCEVPRCGAATLAVLPPGGAVDGLRAALEYLGVVAAELVLPTFQAMSDWFEEAVLDMHADPAYARDVKEGDEAGISSSEQQARQQELSPDDGVLETSRSMQALMSRLAVARQEVLSRLGPAALSTVTGDAGPRIGAADGPPPLPSVPRTLVLRLAARLLTVFVSSAALLPVPGGRPALQLAKDCAELEAGLRAELCAPEAVPGPAAALRALRRALFTEPFELAAGVTCDGSADLSKNPASTNPGTDRRRSPGAQKLELPRSAALHLLFARASAGVQMPHVRAGLTLAQYVVWLDDHDETAALGFIAGAVAAAEVAGQSDNVVTAMRAILDAAKP